MKLTTILLAATLMPQLMLAQATTQWTEKTACKWTKTGAWRNGFVAATPHKTTDYTEFASQYAKNTAVWDSVFTWLATHDLNTIPVGKYPVCGERAFVKVQEAKTRPDAQCRVESHRRYVDLQYTVQGTERYGLVAQDEAFPVTAYKPDARYYELADNAKVTYINSTPHTFFIFFPRNFHIAMLMAGKQPTPIRKVVAKIEYMP